MRQHRFFVEEDLTQSPLQITDTDLLHQWHKVLRLAVGATVILCDGQGNEATATITAIDKASAMIDLGEIHPVTAEPKRDVTLYCSVLKRENFEWVVQKCTEIGVKKIVPILAARTVKTGLKMDRLRIIAREAAEQAGRGSIPDIAEPVEFDRALEKAKHGTHFFFHTSADATPIPYAPLPTPNANIWIGPEGGWTEEELGQAEAMGWAVRSLGELTLRAETAAVIASYNAMEKNPH